jgi:hypothetical protein
MNPLVLLIVGAVGLGGCIILLVLGLKMLRDERSTKTAAVEPPAPAVPGPEVASPTLPAPTPEAPKPAGSPAAGSALAGVTARFTGGARGNAHEVLRVLRDNLTGRLTLEMAGKRYASLDQVADGDVRQGLLTTLHDLQAFAGGAAALPADARTMPASQPARPGGEPAAAPAEYRPRPPPSMNPFKQMAVLRELSKNPPPAPKSIAEQIDEVLQEHLLGTPLIHRGLHVRPGPRGDAVFDADGQSYTSVDDLPDIEVRDVIRAAIAEWEKKQ